MSKSRNINFIMNLYAMYMQRAFDAKTLYKYICFEMDKCGLQRSFIRRLCRLRQASLFKRHLIHELMKRQDCNIAKMILEKVPSYLVNAYIVPGFIASSIELEKVRYVLKDFLNTFYERYGYKYGLGFKRRKCNERNGYMFLPWKVFATLNIT